MRKTVAVLADVDLDTLSSQPMGVLRAALRRLEVVLRATQEFIAKHGDEVCGEGTQEFSVALLDFESECTDKELPPSRWGLIGKSLVQTEPFLDDDGSLVDVPAFVARRRAVLAAIARRINAYDSVRPPSVTESFDRAFADLHAQGVDVRTRGFAELVSSFCADEGRRLRVSCGNASD